jgi:hypothetical protein
MNTDLKQNEICLTSSPSQFFTGGLIGTEKQVASPVGPSLEQMLDEIGPLPKTSLFFGQAQDRLPVLLDLADPRPGAILIAGDPGAGKTHLLRTIARFLVYRHPPQTTQYGVITSCPQEWNNLADVPHCVGIFPVQARSAVEFIRALALWTRMTRMHRQSVLLMIDGLDQFADLNSSAGHDLETLLVHGPANQIWPIATIDPIRSGFAGGWLKYFQTHISGYTTTAGVLDDEPLADCEALSKGTEFRLQARSGRIKFSIPGD